MADGPTGGVDANIALQARAPANNPLEQVGQFANTLQGINQLKMFPGQLQLQQQAVQGGQVGLSQRINQAVNQGLTPLLALEPGKITHAAITSALAGMEARGIPTHGFMTDNLLSTPMPDGPDFEARARAVITSQAMQSPESSVGAVTGSFAPQDQGFGIQPGLTGGPGSHNFGGFTSVGAPIRKYLTPQDLAAQTPRTVTPEEAQELNLPRDATVTDAKINILRRQGLEGLAGPAGQGPFGDGRLPAALRNPNAQPSPQNAPVVPGQQGANAPVNTPPAGPATVPRPVVTGMGSGTAEELGASTQQYNQAAAAGNTFRQRVFPLEQASHALEGADTGPGSETVNQIKSFLLAQSPDALKKYLPGVDPNKIQSYDESVKYLAQYSRGQPGAQNSDMQSQLAQTANASTHISNAAAKQVVMNALGLERMQQAALLQFNQTKQPSQTFSRWMTSEFIPKQDPRGFSWDDQSAAQKANAIKTMSVADKQRLAASVKLSRDFGLMGAAPSGGQ